MRNLNECCLCGSTEDVRLHYIVSIVHETNCFTRAVALFCITCHNKINLETLRLKLDSFGIPYEEAFLKELKNQTEEY